MTTNQKLLAIGILGFIVGFAVCYLWLSTSVLPKPVKTGTDTTTVPTSTTEGDTTADVLPTNGTTENRVVLTNQQPGMEVQVTKAILAQSGWVVIYEYNEGKLGRILGAQLFDSGEHAGTVSLLRAMTVGATYAAVLANDDGDRKFNLANDLQLKDSSGNPIMTVFLAAGQTGY